MTNRTEPGDHPGPEALDRLAADRGGPAAVREHLASCEECREELEWLRQFQAAVVRMPARRPAEGFVDRVMDRVTLPSPAAARGFGAEWLGWSGWAAAGVGLTTAMTAVLGWLWIASRPEFSVEIVAGLVLGAMQRFLLSAALNVGEFLVASGLAGILGDLFGELSTTSALGALGALGVLGLTTGAAALHFLRLPPTLHTMKGASR